jgi:hypothetical protein
MGTDERAPVAESQSPEGDAVATQAPHLDERRLELEERRLELDRQRFELEERRFQLEERRRESDREFEARAFREIAAQRLWAAEVWVRFGLAIGLTLATILLVVVGMLRGITPEQLGLYLASVSSLAAIAVGYFFGREKPDRLA